MWLCQLGISWDALSQAKPTKKQKSAHRGSGLRVEELSSKSSVLLHLHIFYLLKSTPPLKSLWRAVSPRTSIWHETPWYEWGLGRYFRMEDTNLIMLEMSDSCQGETGRTDGWSCKFSRIQHTISGRLKCFVTGEGGTVIWGNQCAKSSQSTWNNPFSDSHNWFCQVGGLPFFTPVSNIKNYLWMNN